MFYEFDQNNSGGSFVLDDKLTHRLFIEAQNSKEANRKAKALGIYFDGCNEGIDCPCCGDRWYEADEWNAVNFPVKYDKENVFESIEEYAQYLADNYSWLTPDVRIFYLDGSVKEFSKEK